MELKFIEELKDKDRDNIYALVEDLSHGDLEIRVNEKCIKKSLFKLNYRKFCFYAFYDETSEKYINGIEKSENKQVMMGKNKKRVFTISNKSKADLIRGEIPRQRVKEFRFIPRNDFLEKHSSPIDVLFIPKEHKIFWE